MHKELKAMGLSEKEADVYLAMFDLGSAVVSDIAKRAGLKRPTTYVVLEELAKRGLVNFTEERGVRLYSPASPERLVEEMKSKSNRYGSLAEDAKKLVKRFKNINLAQTAKQKVQVFEDATDIKNVYEDMLFSLENIRARSLNKGVVKTSPITDKEKGVIPEIAVQGDKIILISPEEKFAAVVESPELAEKLKKILISAKKDSHGKPFFKPETQKGHN